MLAGFEVVALQGVTITGPIRNPGSKMVAWNVDRKGVPFGKIWSFKARGEVHPFHAKPLTADYASFATYAEAENYMRGAM